MKRTMANTFRNCTQLEGSLRGNELGHSNYRYKLGKGYLPNMLGVIFLNIFMTRIYNPLAYICKWHHLLVLLRRLKYFIWNNACNLWRTGRPHRGNHSMFSVEGWSQGNRWMPDETCAGSLQENPSPIFRILASSEAAYFNAWLSRWAPDRNQESILFWSCT